MPTWNPLNDDPATGDSIPVAFLELEGRTVELRKAFAGAVADLNGKFQFGLDAGGTDAEFEKRVIDALPAAWDDGHYIEYQFQANRNWLTPEKPEDFVLTFSARNNATIDLPHRLGESKLAANGTATAGREKMLGAMIDRQKLSSTLAPGSVAKLSGGFNDILPSAGSAHVVWTVRGTARSVDVRFGQ